MNQNVIELKDISKIFNAGSQNEVVAISQVSLALKTGEVILIKGPSGSGKSTLLSVLGCLTKPSSGRYTCLDETVSRWSEKFLTTYRRHHFGIIFQNFNLISGLTVRHNIEAPLIPTGKSFADIKDIVENMAARFNIKHRLDFIVDTLSGGEMQRAAIARSMVFDPQIIIADEPTAHLDSKLATEILDLFAKMKVEGKTIIIASHDPLVENHSMIDTVVCLKDGGIVD